ncbi:hypothetical protein V6N13_013974 [Hibiscus sabdariffa]
MSPRLHSLLTKISKLLANGLPVGLGLPLDVPECGKITLASLDLEEPSEERDGFVAGSHGGNSNKSCNYSGESQDKVQNSHYFLQSVSGQQYFAF